VQAGQVVWGLWLTGGGDLADQPLESLSSQWISVFAAFVTQGPCCVCVLLVELLCLLKACMF
jgi:hypothetical protein